MRPSQFLPAARAELLEAQSYYDEVWPGLGADFVAEVERVLQLLRQRPALGAPGSAHTRRFSLRRFPYSVVYLVESEKLTVVALAHHRRRPDYWRRRL
ncbi:MAG: type II toxin-antitoxin system RelE/ParE family toxin [Dongiaceae bacterium]